MAGVKNNATSSWSGYNHQGQVGIFLALRELSELLQKGKDFSVYSVEFEKAGGEDIDIMDNNLVVSRHQVKAKTTSKNLNDYKNVLEEFNTVDVSEDSRYLHAIHEIIGFGLPQRNFDFLFQNYCGRKPTFVKNLKRVRLYQYPDGNRYCKLTNFNESKIDNFCKTEIKNILTQFHNSLKDDDDHINETLFELKDLLCTKIREAHETGGGANPVILFSEIYKIVTSSEKREKQAIYRAKHLFMLYWNENFESGVDVTIINEILNLEDNEFEQLLKDLHPDNNISKLKDSYTLDNLIDRTSFKYILYSFIKECKKEKFILDELYYKTNHESFRISLINAPKAAAGEVKKDIMKNIGKEFIRASFDTDYLINMNIDGRKFFEEYPIHEGGKEKLQSGFKANLEDNIFSSNLEYIDCVNTIQKLREDRDSDE